MDPTKIKGPAATLWQPGYNGSKSGSKVHCKTEFVQKLARAKERIRIPDLWKAFGLPGRPAKSCRSPFRQDRNPSFSVSADGRLFNDFATGQGGDVIHFIEQAQGLSRNEACQWLLNFAGLNGAASKVCFAKRDPVTLPSTCEHPPKVNLPPLEAGNPLEWGMLANLRHLSYEAVQLAVDRGVLWFATIKGCRSWVLTDLARINAQARKLDGKLWEHISAKAYTLPGSKGAWPIGLKESLNYPTIALVEGGPDLLAAFHLILREGRQSDCGVIAMLGASHSIPQEVLSSFKNKRVRIYSHVDASGIRAAIKWEGQLKGVGAVVDCLKLRGMRTIIGQPVKDLNDLCMLSSEDFEREFPGKSVLPEQKGVLDEQSL